MKHCIPRQYGSDKHVETLHATSLHACSPATQHSFCYLRVITLLLCALGYWTQPAQAEGSRTLYPDPPPAGSSRANLEWRTNTYGGIVLRRTLLKVYANAGENILLGSSAVGVGSGDIFVYNPGRVTGSVGSENVPATADFTCSTQAGAGFIAKRKEELSGPRSISGTGNVNGYTPCYYQAPATGVYNVVFYGPDGGNSGTNGLPTGDINLVSGSNFDTSQGSSVAAWDVTVRSSDPNSTTDLNGRLFSYYLALFTNNNGLPLYFPVYPVTPDGYRYEADLRGTDPNGFIVYGNQVGFFDSDGKSILYHDIIGQDGQVSSPDGGTSLARPQYPTFLNTLDATTLPFLDRYRADGTFDGTGITPSPIPPSVSAASFTGTAGGNNSNYSTGGTFSFSSSIAGNYEITISRDGSNFDPTTPQNRVLRGYMLASGAQSVTWNGQDNSGNSFPVGNNYLVHLKVHAGEYHFPLLDAENNFYGGPTVTLLNAANPLGNKTGFYDDRGYTTVGGTNVGTPGSVLCGINPPTTPFSDPVNGFDTSTNQREYGQAGNNGNTNARCTGSFGDTKGLDQWTYFPSSAATTSVNIIATGTNADLAITKTHSPNSIPEPSPTTPITYSLTVTNNGPSNVAGATVADTVPPLVTGVTWACVISTGTGSCGAASGSGNQINTTVDLNNGATATYTVTGTLNEFVAPNNYFSGYLKNTATVTPPNGITDPTPANNTATDTLDQPHVRLVKRITALNNTSFTDLLNDPSDPNDDTALNWPSGYLQGKIGKGIVPGDEVPVKPTDTLEYTIYFLSDSAGTKDATTVNICDRIPANSTFIPNSFNGASPTDGGLPGTDQGIALALGSATPTVYLTDVNDAPDRGQYFPANDPATPPSCSGNTNGAVVVNVTRNPDLPNLPRATGPGTPSNSYGFIRFRVRVN